MRALLTGAAGFLGSHCLRHLLANTDWHIVCPVSFRHKGLPERIVVAVDEQGWWDRVTIVRCDLAAPINDTTRALFGDINYILNYASESHVDRSIDEPVPFIQNNIEVALNVLEYARVVKPEVFVQVSTDEVYGPAPDGYDCAEWDPIVPSNPYSASKAAQEAIAISYWRTYGVNVIITNCFDMQTRVLTESGLKFHGDLHVGDRVWALNDAGEMVLEPVLGLLKKPYVGDMVRVLAKGSSQLVTPDHRMMIQRAHGKPRHYGPVEETLASSLHDMKGRVRIPRFGRWTGNDAAVTSPYEHFTVKPGRRTAYRLPEQMPTELVAELFGWFVAEGCTSHGTVRISQASSPSRVAHIIGLLNEFGKDDAYENSGAACVSNPHLADFLDLCGGKQPVRRIPLFLKQQSEKYLRILLDAMVDGDGTRYGDGIVYYTTSRGLAEDVCEIGMKLGYATRISQRETWNFRKTEKTTSWVARLTSAKGDIEARNVSLETYDGDVWCLSVPSGRVFVERDGIISLSGQCMNLIGETQDPEKFVPMIISKVLDGERMPIHASADGIIGSRFYLHARNLADAILFLLRRGNVARYETGAMVPDRWNIVGEREVTNLEMAQMVADCLGKPLQYELIDFHTSRPGHDLRYALDGTKLAAAGWTMPVPLDASIKALVDWTRAHPEWANRRPN